MSDFILYLLYAISCAPLAFWWCCCGGGSLTGSESGSGVVCWWCEDSEFLMPMSVQVVLTGTTDGTAPGSCGDCENLDGTYILEPRTVFGGYDCGWEGDTPVVCSGRFSKVWVTINDVLTVSFFGTAFSPPLNDWLVFRTEAAPGFRNCLGWSSFDVPRLASDRYCSNTSATCTITAL